MSMSLDQARQVDPILTDHARGYSNGDFIGDGLFPIVDMPTRAARRIEFNRDSFKRYKTRRAPGANIAAVTFGYDGKPVSLIQHALMAMTPVEHQEEAQSISAPGIDLQKENTDLVLYVIAQEKEIAQAELARNAAVYAASNKVALAGTDRWISSDSDPLALITDYSEVVRKRTGRRPNTLAIGGTVAAGLRKHGKIRDHFKYTTSERATIGMVQQYLGIENLLVGDAVYDDDQGNTVDVWGGDAILAYVPAKGARNMRLPGYGYTYRLRNHPFVESVRYDRDTRSWKNEVFDEYSPELVGPDAGVLIQNAG